MTVRDFKTEGEQDDGYPLIWAVDTRPQLDTSAMMDRVFKPESLIVTYGESNSGKTFNVLDQDLRIASGAPWFDRPTQKTTVVYVAAEGPHSVQNRVFAYCAHLIPEAEPSFALMPYPIRLFGDHSDTLPLIDFIKRTEDQTGCPVGKVTIDTLARAMSGGNENMPDDMGTLIHCADMIRHECSAAVHFIHHSGKNTAAGARGHSSLRAATDTEIEVSAQPDGLHVAKITKQRDWAIGDEFAFRLVQVEVGRDLDNNPVTTCVPKWDRDAVPKQPGRPKPSPSGESLLKTMKEVMGETKELPPVEVRSVPSNRIKGGQYAARISHIRTRFGQRYSGKADKPDSIDRQFRRAIEDLKNKQHIQVYEDWAWLLID